MTQIAKFAHHPLLTHFSVGIGMSTSGTNFIVVGPRSYNFGTFLTYSQEYKPHKLENYQKVKQILDPIFTLLDAGVLNSYRDLLVNIDMVLDAIISANYN